jgi:hypothetical protein
MLPDSAGKKSERKSTENGNKKKAVDDLHFYGFLGTRFGGDFYRKIARESGKFINFRANPEKPSSRLVR